MSPLRVVPAPRIRQAAILVGGLGTRLGALTAATPKPLLACGDRPFLGWILRELVRFGIEEVLLLAGFRADVLQAALPTLQATLPRPLALRCLQEPAPAGTGGALVQAGARLDERFLLCNGDSWLDCNLAGILGAASTTPSYVIGHMVLRHIDAASRYGVVDLAGDRVTAFRDRPPDAADALLPGLMNAGIYVFDRRVLTGLPPVCSLERDVMPGLAAGGALRGSVVDGYFIDIGIPADLARAQTELPARLRRPALLLATDLFAGATDPAPWSALAAATEAGWHVFTFGEATVSPDLIQAARLAGSAIEDHCDHAGLVPLLARWQVDPARACLLSRDPMDRAAAAAAGLSTPPFFGDMSIKSLKPLLAGFRRSPPGA